MTPEHGSKSEENCNLRAAKAGHVSSCRPLSWGHSVNGGCHLHERSYGSAVSCRTLRAAAWLWAVLSGLCTAAKGSSHDDIPATAHGAALLRASLIDSDRRYDKSVRGLADPSEDC